MENQRKMTDFTQSTSDRSAVESPSQRPSPSSRDSRSLGVQFAEGLTASALLHGLLRKAVQRFPELEASRVPADAASFRGDYAETLVRFEAARVVSESRTAIAASIADDAYAALSFVSEDGSVTPLAALFTKPAAPFDTTRVDFPGAAGLRPRVAYKGREFQGAALRELGQALVDRSLATGAAAESLGSIAALADASERGAIDLSGRRVVVLGANAELSPVPMLLEAGADVLWIDLAAPGAHILNSTAFAGSLTYVDLPADLLLAPHRIAATIDIFADGAPIDVVLAAYAPAGGREWRLQAAMNAIVRAINPSQLRGVGLYISPTAPSVLQPSDTDAAAKRAEKAPAWQRALAAAGALRRAPFVNGDMQVARSLVGIQGVSYQAAQYVEKILAAERFAILGTRNGITPPRVSANVAPITSTKSLEHPLFQAGFIGASHLGVEVFAPETTRALSGLLLLSDLLAKSDRAPVSEHPQSVFMHQVHGGVFSMAYGLNEAIRVAAVLGMTSRPSLLLDLIRKR